MALTYEIADWRSYKMNWHDPHRQIEPVEHEAAVVDAGLALLAQAGVLPHADYDHAKLLAHRAAVADQFEIPWTAISHRMQRLLYAINAIRQPQVMVAVGIFCGNTFISNAGAAIGPGACYRAARLVGLEIRTVEAERARRNVNLFRGDDAAFPAEVLGQDGLSWLQAFDGAIDLLYLDADGPRGSGKSIYLDLLTAGRHALRPGSLVLAHNSVNSAHTMADYLATVRDPAHFRQSVNMIVDDQGLEVSLY
jgi:predicted O-methyltransferase YrrM